MTSNQEKKSSNSNERFSSDLTFLVLEDLDNLRNQMISDLRASGVVGKIHEAASVQSAISICNSAQISFFISDWSLPDGTGNDFLKKIRSIEQYKTTPFIMCTNHGEINYFLEAVANGANDYIVKPWTLEELQKKLFITWDLHNQKKGTNK
jgi:two-component system chemotaxis response regulator CheY